MKVMVCVNYDRNGMFSGKVRGISVNGSVDILIDLYCMMMDGIKCEFTTIDGVKTFIIGKDIKVTYHSKQDWVGNWCWDMISVTEHDVAKLLNQLRESEKWDFEMGLTEFSDLWESDKPFRTKHFEAEVKR